MKKTYLIKTVSPWMIDELISLADVTDFSLVFIRKPERFYKSGIEVLEQKGVKIFFEPFESFYFSRISFVLFFIFKNIGSFFQNYSFVIGLKSIWWFLCLNKEVLNTNSIHAQFATQASILAWMVKEYNRKETTYFFTYHAYDIYFKNLWFTKLVDNAENAFSISKYNIDYVQTEYAGIDESKLILSRLGTRKPPSCDTKEKEEVLTLGFISWFVAKKGIFILLEAMKKLKKNGYKIKLIMAGDGPLKTEILSFTNINNLDNYIEYLGKIGENEKHNFFCNLDAFVLPAITVPNDQDGIPVVLMEAISYNLPLISTEVSGIPEICFDGYNGILIPEKDVDALVKAITEMYVDEENKMKSYSINSGKVFERYNIVSNTKNKAQFMGWI